MIDQPTALLIDTTTLGAQVGPGIRVTGSRSYGIQTVVTGAPTFSLTVQGSMNGSDWVDLSGAISTANITYVVDKPVVFVRANITSFTLGTNPRIKVYIAAAE